MRVLPIVCNDVTFQPRVYEKLLEELGSSIVGMAIVPFTTKKMGKVKTASFLFHLYGVRGVFLKGIQVITLKLRVFLNSFFGLGKPVSLEQLARHHNVPVRHFSNINSSEFLEWAESLSPDVIISSQAHFIGKKLLSLPKIGVINKHAGKLPKYRGLYPVFWAMKNNEASIGITVHFMNSEFDGGAILLQEEIPITVKDTLETLYDSVVRETPGLFIRALSMIEGGDYELTNNPKDEATYFSIPTPSDIREFRREGKKII